jgi:hypothetical protein
VSYRQPRDRMNLAFRDDQATALDYENVMTLRRKLATMRIHCLLTNIFVNQLESLGRYRPIFWNSIKVG